MANDIQTLPAGVTLKTLTIGDINILAQVVDQFWGLESQEAAINRFLKDPTGCVVTAFSSDKLVGYCYGYRLERFDGDPIALLWDLEVKAAHRNKGIGSALIKEFVHHTGVDRRTLLLVEPDNGPLKNLCQKLGAAAGAPAMIYRFEGVEYL